MQQARRHTGKLPVFSYEDREKAESLVKARDIVRRALHHYRSETPKPADADPQLDWEIELAIDFELVALEPLRQEIAQREILRQAG